MNTRLKQFIAAENITQAQLADTINVVRASVSHILAGRNKPSYEFISGLMSHYPNLNMEWLMFGKGKMYKNSPTETQNGESGDLFAAIPTPAPHPVTIPDPVAEHHQDSDPDDHTSHDITAAPVAVQPQNGVSLTEIKTLISTLQTPVNQRKLIKITAFFDDGTFQELIAN